MTTQPIHLPRHTPVFGGPAASRKVAGGAAIMLPTSAADHAEVLRRRIALTTSTLAFTFGAGAIGFAIGGLPGM